MEECYLLLLHEAVLSEQDAGRGMVSSFCLCPTPASADLLVKQAGDCLPVWSVVRSN